MIRTTGRQAKGADRARDRSRKWTVLLWTGLLAALVLASVVPASASESSGAAAWGLNNDSQLGNGNTTTEKEAVVVKVLTESTAVAGGEFHSLALLKTGKVMSWGLNNDGQLGNNTTTNEKEPVEVKGITEAVAIAAGADHSLALLKSGKVMAWGLNNDGQLGNNTTTNEKEAVEVKGITEAIAIAAGSDYSLAVLKSGKVMAWGDNNDGQLGNNTTTNEKEPVEVKKITEASSVAGGEFHSLALLKTGKVMAWGENNDGQLGNGTTTTEKEPVEVKVITEATSIAAGHNHSLAVLKNGKAMAWGDNNDGQLGNNTTTNEKEPVEVKGLTEATAVAGGEFHSLALLASGKVMAWGENNDGQLGNNTTTNEKESVEVKGLSGVVGGISAGANFSLASYAMKPANTALPAISGEAKDEKTLTASTGTWTGSLPITYSYQWESCNASGESCTNISGATSSTYAIAHEQVGHTLRVKVTAKNNVGEASATSAQTATVAASVPVNTTLPVISGKAEVGQLLAVSNGTWSGTPATKYTYQWESCVSKTCKAITGATESSYRVIGSQLSDTLRAVVTDENPAGKVSANSAETATITAGPPVNTALPTISGTARDGQTLSASTGSWAGTEPFSYTYQWRSCNSAGEGCSSISGATSSTYKLTSGYVGKTLRIVVTAKNSVESTEATSSASAVVLAAPPSNTSLPVISGAAEGGQLLSVSNGSWEGTPPISYEYQWETCNSSGGSCSNISGATASSYRVLNSQIGGTLRVVVTASNSAGSEKATSAATATIVAGPPANTELPAISGNAEEGETLSANTGSWAGAEPFSYTYQWQSCNSAGEGCSSISGATSSTYKLTSGYVGKTLRIVVTAKNSVGSTEATSSPSAVVIVPGPPSNTALPAISGIARDGQTLSASTGTWRGPAPTSYAYQWESCNLEGEECHNIEGAASQIYTLRSGNLETILRVVVTATNSLGSSHATSGASAEVEPGAPSELEAPSISGEPNAYETLHADAGAWGGTETETSYQWEYCNATGGECASIVGATSSKYQIGEAEIGVTVRLRVGVSNKLGSVTAVSSATEVIGNFTSVMNTSAPSITGTPSSGHTLTANAGSWSGIETISYTYQWESCNSYGGGCKNIEGATTSTYVLGSGSIGDTLRVRVGASETGGTTSQTSAATQPIAAEKHPVSEGAPTVSGTGLKGQVLTGTVGKWSGESPITYSYQWERCGESGEGCSAISGATASMYTLAEADLGSTLRVLVTATDEGGSTTVPSTATATISHTTLVNVVVPSVTGVDEIGRALSADRGIWTGEGALAYTYKWERCNEKGESCSAITGATESSYTATSADVGKTLRVVVTAEGAAGKESANSAVTPVIGSESLEPTNLFAPTTEGNLTPGETLTAQTGTWVSSETISYSYQWTKCNEEGEECTSISGATSSTYKLIEGDINSTLRVTVTGKNSLGTASATSEQTEVVEAAGPPANTTKPVINGSVKLGERLVAGNGSWSGSRPLSYYYRWERCNNAGESCVSIESATKPSYTVASADVGSTLRVKVTAKNSLSSAGAVSTQTSVVVGSEASATSAIELAEKTDPSVLQPAAVDTIEGQEIKPALSDSGESLSGTTALTTSSVSKETPGEFAVNTPAGELSFQPVNSAPNATKTPTIVNGAAAVFAGTSNVTDTIVRPDALGTTTLLQLHSSAAPTSYSWEIGIGPNQKLEKLSSGDVAVVEVPSTSPLEGSLGEGLGSEASETTAEHEGSGESSEAAENTLEEGVSGEVTLEKLAAAPIASTPVVEPKSGELHPQETKVQYETAKSTVASAEEHTLGTTLMVIEPPKVMDAKGNTVSSSLTDEGSTITVTISLGGATFPVTAQTNIAAPSNETSATKASKVRYGLSDPKATSFEDSEETAGKTETHFDKHVKEGMHVGIARDVVYYRQPNMPELTKWLEAVKKAGLEPFITFGVEPAQMCHPHKHCSEPQIVTYEKDIKAIMEAVKNLYKAKPTVIPPVTLWGAWNEPDLKNELEENPLAKNAKRAALFWKKARSLLAQVGCGCTMLAGEFAEDDGYIGEYAAVIQHNHSFGSAYPHVWGFHDYHDLENYYHHPYNSYAEAVLQKLGRRLHDPRIWFSEQGVALRNGLEPTELAGNSEGENVQRQLAAAKDFQRLGSMHLAKEQSRVEMVDYYLYKGPSAATLLKEENAFDSALLPGEGVTEEEKHPAENPRPAYCVLALGLEGCPAKSITLSTSTSNMTSEGGTVSLIVNPNGLATHYLIEYGTTEAYGKTTSASALADDNGKQSETVSLSGLEPCTTYHYQAEAENKANEEEKMPGFGGDKTFKTNCKATTLSVAYSSVCASLINGGVECWGQLSNWDAPLEVYEEVPGFSKAAAVSDDNDDGVCALLSTGGVDCVGWNKYGQLGDGNSEEVSSPVAAGISSATGISSGEYNSCAVLSGGGIDCWGNNKHRVLGTEYPLAVEEAPEKCGYEACSRTPIAVSEVTNATGVAVTENHACAVLATGQVKCWSGSNGVGQLGDGERSDILSTKYNVPHTVESLSNATSISTGGNESCAVLATGGVDCWGENHYEEPYEGGDLGDGLEKGPEKCQTTPDIYCSDVPVAVVGITNATEVAVGSGFACARLSTGHVMCWGRNTGTLGDGTETKSDDPVEVSGLTNASAVAAGPNDACAILTEGSVKCWGDDVFGQITPRRAVYENILTPTRVPGFG